MESPVEIPEDGINLEEYDGHIQDQYVYRPPSIGPIPPKYAICMVGEKGWMLEEGKEYEVRRLREPNEGAVL